MIPYLRIYLHLTKACNLRCRYCYVGEKAAERMTLEVGRQAIDHFLAKTQYLDIRYFGGEPLIERTLIEQLVAHVEERRAELGKRVGQVIVTNGTLLTEDFARFCADKKIGCSISMDGAERSQDANRVFGFGKGSFAIIDANLPHVMRELPHTHAVCVVGPDNVEYIEEALTYLVERGFSSVSVSPEYTHPAFLDCLSRFEQGLLTLSEKYDEWKRSGRRVMIDVFESEHAPFVRGRCQFGRGEFSVDPIGDIYPCTCFVDSHRHRLGNVAHGVDPELERSFLEQVDALERHIQSAHADCPPSSLCRKGCGCTNIVTTGSLATVDPRLCAFGVMEARVREQVRTRRAFKSLEQSRSL